MQTYREDLVVHLYLSRNIIFVLSRLYETYIDIFLLLKDKFVALEILERFTSFYGIHPLIKFTEIERSIVLVRNNLING